MAGDWIPMRLDLDEDPAVIRMAETTGLGDLAVIGRLWKLWRWANRQLSNGCAAGVTEKWIDAHVSATGFAKAMVDVGWLTINDEGVTFPKFDVWNSKGAKRRLLSAKRMRQLRDADSATSAQRQRNQRREEKRRDKDTPKPPRDGTSTGRFDDFWRAWPKRVAKSEAVRAWNKLSPDDPLVVVILSDVARRAASPDWKKEGGKYIPNPATYLNGRRWEDEGVTDQPDPELEAMREQGRRLAAEVAARQASNTEPDF